MVKNIGFNTDRETNLKENFKRKFKSNITFNLNNGTCKP